MRRPLRLQVTPADGLRHALPVQRRQPPRPSTKIKSWGRTPSVERWRKKGWCKDFFRPTFFPGYGTYFAVWAPNARNVSIVGNFNNWDGRKHQMRKMQGGRVGSVHPRPGHRRDL